MPRYNRETLARQKELLDGIEKLQQTLESVEKRGANAAADIADIERQTRALTEKLQQASIFGPHLELVGAKIGNIRVESATPKLGIFGRPDRPTQIGTLEIVDPRTSQRMATERRVTLKSSLPANVPIYPSSTAVYTVLLDVKRSFIFPPSNYLLQFSANFSFEPPSADNSGHGVRMDHLLTNAVAYEIAIRPSIYSLIGGAVIGGVAGAMARLMKASVAFSFDMLSWSSVVTNGFAVLLSIILSAVAIIFVARKSDAQSFISVEDFWGGLLIGFFVGYTGTEFFGDLTKLGGPPNGNLQPKTPG